MIHSFIGFKTNARYYALNILEELDSVDEVGIGINILQLFMLYSTMLIENLACCISLKVWPRN